MSLKITLDDKNDFMTIQCILKIVLIIIDNNNNFEFEVQFKEIIHRNL